MRLINIAFNFTALKHFISSSIIRLLSVNWLIDLKPYRSLRFFLIMERNINWVKYLSPFIGILFCPVTILFLWSIWSGPVIDTDADRIEEVNL